VPQSNAVYFKIHAERTRVLLFSNIFVLADYLMRIRQHDLPDSATTLLRAIAQLPNSGELTRIYLKWDSE
jgi:hypothetical protein